MFDLFLSCSLKWHLDQMSSKSRAFFFPECCQNMHTHSRSLTSCVNIDICEVVSQNLPFGKLRKPPEILYKKRRFPWNSPASLLSSTFLVFGSEEKLGGACYRGYLARAVIGLDGSKEAGGVPRKTHFLYRISGGLLSFFYRKGRF